jgi:surfeit locus 1 family protein
MPSVGEMNKEHSEYQAPRSTATLIVFAAAFAFAFGGFLMLGIWQVERRTWKLDLIERVEARVSAAPVAAPARAAWPAITAARDEYKHIRLDGHFLPAKNTRVQAVTALGAGYWLLTPFQTNDGDVVLVNRGFIPPSWQGETQVPAATAVSGLLRLPETRGGFLRENDAAANRWYSRDVAAIAAARGLPAVAPYFVDADADIAAPTAFPRGGLTVIHFANNHFGYALTWFGLALMVAAAGAFIVRDERAVRAATAAREAYRERRVPPSSKV